MRLQVAVIPTEGDYRIENVEVTLDWLKEQVGGWIEHVTIHTHHGRRLSAYVNEEGRLYRLPINPLGTLLYDPQGRDPANFICGTMVLCGPITTSGNDTSLSSEDMNYLIGKAAEVGILK